MKTSSDHGRRSLRYRQDTTLEHDSSRTMVTFRDARIDHRVKEIGAALDINTCAFTRLR